MDFPKIKFSPMTLEENIETIKWAFFDDNEDLGVHNYTIQYFPELAEIDLNSKKEEVYEIIRDIVTKDYEQYKKRIESESIRYNKLWSEYNDKYFYMLSNFLGANFPKNIKKIDAHVGLIPIFPRYLDSFSFSISTGLQDWKLIEVAAHETLHFLWFEKWKIMHPETPRRHFDSPFNEWRYSEMVTDPILNNKPFTELFKFTEKSYDSFYELYDNDDLVMNKLRNIYSTDDSIEEKIEKGYKYINDYFNKINKRDNIKK